ncbi:MAG: hypothetical protein J0G33_12630 [Afipia felis]|nr:hypothetical protein [Afipia felis]
MTDQRHIFGPVVPMGDAFGTDDNRAGERTDGMRDEAGSTFEGFDPLNVFNFVRQLAEGYRIDISFNGAMRIRGQDGRVQTPEQIKAFLRADQVDESVFVHRAIILNNALQFQYRVAEIRAATKELIHAWIIERKAQIVEKLIAQVRPLTVQEAAQADAAWASLATVFDIDADLVVASLKHFIWQILRKQLGLKIEHHLMPVIIGQQGSGKTRFVESFLKPLCEAASAPVRTSDITDKRVIGMLRYLVLWLDDMEQIPAGPQVDNLKNFLTSEAQLRRVLHSSMDVIAKQNATLIGTSNHRITEIVPDETGHRRFVELPFRNGNVARGGDASIWPIINALPMELLFRSVDAHLDSPIVPHLSGLVRHQSNSTFKSPLEKWLDALDRDSPAIRSITTPYGVRAGGLQKLYEAQKGSKIGNAFAEEIESLIARSRGPFSGKIRDRNRSYYYVFRVLAGATVEDPPPETAGESEC